MNDIGKKIYAVGQIMQHNNLGLNLLYWSTWSAKSTPHDTTQTVRLLGDPAYILNKRYMQATIANLYSDCNINASKASFDVANARATVSFSLEQLLKYPTCFTILNPSLLGYDPTISGDFTISVDVHTLVSVMSVSYLINGASSLTYFTTVRIVFDSVMYKGVEYQVLEKYDPAYPGMDVFTCVGPRDSDSNWNCVIKIADSYGMPFFLHAGGSKTTPVVCNCSDAIGQSDTCDSMDLIYGFLVFDHTLSPAFSSNFPPAFRPLLPMMEVYYDPPPVSARLAAESVFPVAWAAVKGQRNASFQDYSWRLKSYNVTLTANFGRPSMVVFRVWDNSDLFINSNRLYLGDGGCADSVSSPQFERLVHHSWGELVEDYYQCLMHFIDALFNALGIAVGTAVFMVPPAILIVSYFIYGVLAVIHHYNPNRRSVRNHSTADRAQGPTGEEPFYMENLTKLGKL